MDTPKLSDFIRTNLDPILSDWEKFAKDIPAARHLKQSALRDHAIDMLRAIAANLDEAQTPLEQTEKSKGRAPRSARQSAAELHGAARVSEGFSVNDAVAEFRALRASVLRLWIESSPIVPHTLSHELMRFNEAIDQALAESLARHSADKERYASLFDTLLSSSPDLHCIFDVDDRLVYANQSFARLHGMSIDEIIGKKFSEVFPVLGAELRPRLQQVIDDREPYRREIAYTIVPGREATYEYFFVPVFDNDGGVKAIAATAHDVTERKDSEAEIRRSANYDSLTGLPNRSQFRDRLEREAKHSARTGLPLALLFIDLDGFKEVNDRLGHDAGDQLLRETARRITSCVRGTDTVARVGGDEFTVILTELNKTAHVEILTQQILDELAKPFSILRKDVHISGSIGITFFPQDATTPENLVRNADQAMYVAKKAGRNRFSFFTIDMRNSAWARLKVMDALRQALPKHQLSVYYQPIVDLATGRIAKAEALLRWHHPQNGLVYPAAFIGLAEEIGLIGEIGEWVLGEAVTRVREWSALLGAPFQISVNKSPVEFMSKAPMRNWDTQLAALGLAWNSISVEITEGLLLNDSPSVREKLNNLQAAGVQLAIDDFGTGYSSMAYLRKFKVDFLKIDQSFVHDMSANVDSRIVAETIIVMAHKLGLKVIAEGVETADQMNWLRAAGCDFAQGYVFSPPVSAQDFEKLLTAGAAQHQKME